ncbi:MAG: GNAT family N-acetyltransferase [Caldilineales bacterium]|nr:GNAT family N-acetyltransferase [Caldilineales bacterium]
MIFIRRPTLHDLNECAQIDASYNTQRVWQLSLGVEPNDIAVHLHLVHLPRAVNVPGEPQEDNLLKQWQRGDCMLSARQDREVVGFIHLIADSSAGVAHIQQHVVRPDYRRQGVGTKLLSQAMLWGQDRNLRSVMVQVSTKNHPAISFYFAHGFSFCGFNERFYSDHEITLDLARTIR